MLESLLVHAIVALAEIGDKTQLLALILAARFRKPWPIIAGIVAAALANHAAAGAVGPGSAVSSAMPRCTGSLAASFLADLVRWFRTRWTMTKPAPRGASGVHRADRVLHRGNR